MGVESWILAALAAAVIAQSLFRVGRALWLGRLRIAGEVYGREDQPRRYWSELATHMLLGAVLALTVWLFVFPSMVGFLVGLALAAAMMILGVLAPAESDDDEPRSHHGRNIAIICLTLFLVLFTYVVLTES
jgi:uncharacterized membrane protein